MRVLLYGGTFDPPHNGHLNNLRAAAARVCPQQIVVMPAGVPPHKAASATPAALRLQMCGCFAALSTAQCPVEVSDWEIRQTALGRPNYTAYTLQMLAQRWPGAALYLAVGSDMLLTFHRWHRWQDIVQQARLVVVSREIGDSEALHRQAKRLDPGGGRILFAPTDALPMASHQLRARLAAGDGCPGALPAAVRQLIWDQGLYGCRAAREE